MQRNQTVFPLSHPDTPDIVGQEPARSIVSSFGLELNVLIWGSKTKPPVMLLHGTRDHARSWDWTVRELVKDYCVVVPDLRGHGDSGHAPGGGYDFHSMVADMARVMEHLEKHEGISPPLMIIGHSLGGNIALNLTAAFPEKISRVISMEGLGVSQDYYDRYREEPPGQHLRKWIDQRNGKNDRQERRYASPDEAVQRMAGVHQNLSPEQARHLALHGLREWSDYTEPAWGWKYDPLIGFSLPYLTPPEDYLRMFATIECPALLMRGTKSWASDPEQDGRMKPLKTSKLINYEGAGHWLHHDAFDAFINDVQDFLKQES